MNWFKEIISNLLEKTASKADIKNRALQRIQEGTYSPRDIAVEFIGDMSREDAGFVSTNWTQRIMDSANNLETLLSVINNFPIEEETTQLYQGITPEIRDTTFVGEEEGEEEGGGEEGEEGEASPEDTEDTVEEGVITEEGIEGEEEVLTKQPDAFPSLNKKVVSDPTLLETFEIPAAKSDSLLLKFSKINKKLKDMYYPEIKLEFVGNAYDKPVYYGGRAVNEPFIRVKISGTLPSPTEEISIRVYEPAKDKKGNIRTNPDGSTKMNKVGDEPKGVRLIAKVHHHPLTEVEQVKYLETLSPESPLRAVIESNRAEGQVPFFNTVEALGETDIELDPKFYYSPAQECFSCKVKHARIATYVGAVVSPEQMVNKTATIMENGVPREITLTRKVNINKNRKENPVFEDQPIKIIPDELIEAAQQEQFGGSCIDPFDAVKTINNLKNWVKRMKNSEEMYKKKKEKSKYPGGTRGNRSTMALFSVAVNMMRDPNNDTRNMLYSLSNKAYYYEESLKPEEERRKHYNYFSRRSKPPKVTEEDKQIASDTINWWRERLGGFDLEREDQNKVTLSILPTIGTANKPGYNNMKNIIEMINTYLSQNNITLPPFIEEVPEVPEVSETPVAETPTTILGDPIRGIGETPEEPAAEPTPGGTIFDNLQNVQPGNAFISKLKHKESKEWYSKRGISHYLLDNAGNKYVIFEKYPYDRTTGTTDKTPSFTFDPGIEYIIRGEKGEKNDRYKTTILNNPKIVSPDRINDYIGNSETETQTEATPEVQPETAQEVPVEEKRQTGSIQNLTEIAKDVLSTGRTRKGVPITPEKLIPLYVKNLTKYVPKLNVQDWEDKLNMVLEQRGVEALIRYLDIIPGYLGK